MVREWFRKLKKGVKAGMAAVVESNELTDNRILKLIKEFDSSEKMKDAKDGERYYRVKNDIRSRKMQRNVNGKMVDESYKANNRLAHAKYKNQVDEKISYLLSNTATYKCDQNEKYIDKVKDILGKHFQHQLIQLGYEASNKAIGWLHPYIDENGIFKTMVIPFEQGVPVWKDKEHLELEMFIRRYNSYVWQYDEKKTITNVEVWTSAGVTFYRQEGDSLIYQNELNMDEEYGPVSHFWTESDGWTSWGKVPFVPFKNNFMEIPDIVFVKSLIDAYDISRSDTANYIDDVKNIIYVLKGYGGASLGEFMYDLNHYRAIKIDDAEDGGVDVLNPSMDNATLKEHYEQLKRDIIEDGQSVNKDPDKYGNSPSGVALKFMYSGLDLKCNLMEGEFKISFEILLYFVDKYLAVTGQGNFQNEEVEIVFNRNMTVNESEQIQNCNNSKGTIATKSVLAHHPYVEDVESELEAIKAEQLEKGPNWDQVPPVKDGDGDGEE